MSEEATGSGDLPCEIAPDYQAVHRPGQDLGIKALAGRPGLAEAESEPAAIAKCESLHASLAGFRPPQRRVDLWVTGPLTLVHTDGVLWYLAICSSPRIRVLCVTYSDNGMKVGEWVTLRGAYRAVDDLHVVLDPCLASRT
jgi:hypothetical protein